jgi:RNA polymerase subunit RPABC4/transcription elongation factor Spt4
MRLKELNVRFSRYLGDIVIFVVAALVIYLLGAALLAVWPMWTMMWAMMGFGSGWLLVVLVLAIALGAVWLSLRGSARLDAGNGDLQEHCPECQATVKPDYLLCPECHAALRNTCQECRRALKTDWSRCPWCGTDTTKAPTTAAPVSSGGWDGATRALHAEDDGR